MAETIRLQPGENVTLFTRNVSSIPMSDHVQAATRDTDTLDGDVET